MDTTTLLAAEGSVIATSTLVAAGAATANNDGSMTFGPDGSTVFLAGPGAKVSSTGPALIFGAGDHDTYALTTASGYYNASAITAGFNQANGDVLDVSAILAGTAWDHTAATLGNYLHTGQSGSDFVRSASNLPDCYASGTIATLHNTAGVTLASLEANGALKLI